MHTHATNSEASYKQPKALTTPNKYRLPFLVQMHWGLPVLVCEVTLMMWSAILKLFVRKAHTTSTLSNESVISQECAIVTKLEMWHAGDYETWCVKKEKSFTFQLFDIYYKQVFWWTSFQCYIIFCLPNNLWSVCWSGSLMPLIIFAWIKVSPKTNIWLDQKNIIRHMYFWACWLSAWWKSAALIAA